MEALVGQIKLVIDETKIHVIRAPRSLRDIGVGLAEGYLQACPDLRQDQREDIEQLVKWLKEMEI